MSRGTSEEAGARERIGFHLDREEAARFKAAARLRDGGMSAALVRMVRAEISAEAEPTPAPKGAGQSGEVKIRLRGDERMALLRTARERGVTPASWVRSLTLVHLLRRPEWNPEERAALRAISGELRRIGVNINQIAAALNAAALVGQCPPGQGEAAERAVDLVRIETRRLAAVVTGNFDYYGLPWDERPTPARGAVTRRNLKEEREATAKKRKPKLRPKKFVEGKGTGRD